MVLCYSRKINLKLTINTFNYSPSTSILGASGIVFSLLEASLFDGGASGVCCTLLFPSSGFVIFSEPLLLFGSFSGLLGLLVGLFGLLGLVVLLFELPSELLPVELLLLELSLFELLFLLEVLFEVLFFFELLVEGFFLIGWLSFLSEVVVLSLSVFLSSLFSSTFLYSSSGLVVSSIFVVLACSSFLLFSSKSYPYIATPPTMIIEAQTPRAFPNLPFFFSS